MMIEGFGELQHTQADGRYLLSFSDGRAFFFVLGQVDI